MNNIGIKIGGVEKGEVENVTDCILQILEARADQKTIRKALSVMVELGETRNISMNNVRVEMVKENDCNDCEV